MTTLYFIRGAANEEQRAVARKTGAKIRNSLAYREGDFIEKCDAVMGDIPEGYQHLPHSGFSEDAREAMPVEETAPVAEHAPVKRGRGRPRKNPIDTQ